MKIKDLIWKESTGNFRNREFQFEAEFLRNVCTSKKVWYHKVIITVRCGGVLLIHSMFDFVIKYEIFTEIS